MPFGYNGKILRVNLSNESESTECLEENFYRQYHGGAGFVVYYLLKELKPRIDPLGSQNKLIFASGVITGAPIPGSGRNSVGAKSPLTGAYGEAEVGGFWGAELKRTGFDAVIVEGRAEKPVYLWITDDGAEIRDAAHLWGKVTHESEEIIRQELGDKLIRTAQIGPGGENLVRYASINNDIRHAAARTGMGAVMGSKRLKAIAVRGHKRLETADPEKLREMTVWLNENLKDLATGLHLYGTGAAMDAFEEIGCLPIRNFRDGKFPNVDAISAKTIKETVRIKMVGCYACPIQCKKVVKLNAPWTVDPVYGGPEYETLAALGSDCGIDDLAAICKANELCEKYTLDTISTGAVIAFAMECFENGLITEKDTDGIQLNFGNAKAMVQMVEKIAKREGIGDLLAEGVLRAAEKLGEEAKPFAIHVKGQEVPMHDPRLKRGLGLGYAVSPTGAEHCNSIHDTQFSDEAWRDLKSLGILAPVSVEDFSSKKVRLFIYWVNWRILDDCWGLCNFLPWDYNQKVDIVRAITGWNSTAWELVKTAERVITLARIYNIREGFTQKDDWLPSRFFEPQTSGPLSRTTVDGEKLRSAIRTYYAMMGWDKETGIPLKEKLDELDIAWAANGLTNQK